MKRKKQLAKAEKWRNKSLSIKQSQYSWSKVAAITIVAIKNPFDHADRDIREVDYCHITTIAGYIRPALAEYDANEVDIIVSVNGGMVEQDCWDTTTLSPGAYVAICPVVGKGGSGKNILGMIAGIALSVATIGVGNMASGLGWGGVSGATMGFGWTFGGYLAAFATMYLGGMLVSHIVGNANVDTSAASPTYSWSKMSAMTGQGNPIAITYGTVKSAGQLLSQHISSDGDKQYLNLLLAAGDGPLDDISGITINDNPVANYSDVTVEVRLGTNDQTAISNFGDQFADQALSYEITTDNYVTQLTEGNGNQGLEVTIEFPNGLYHVNDDGSLASATVVVAAEYRAASGSWLAWDTWTITDSKNSGVRRAYRLDNLVAGQYEVRLKCLSKSGTSTRDATRPYWTQLSGIMYDDFARPGRALIGIKALATDQLNGSPSITWIQKRLNVWVYNPNTGVYEQKPANNPAWAAYDLIHRCKKLKNIRASCYVYKVFGAPADRMTYQDFANWAAFCTARGLEVNLIIDKAADLWTALKDIEAVGRGKVVMKGTRFACICDAPGSAVQMFTMGNIVKGSFKEEYLAMKDRANAIEVTFNNAAKNYERDTVTVYGDDWNTTTAVKNPTQVTMDGITTLSQAYKEAKYRLRLNKYLIRTVSFEASIEAIACQVGDVILVQHDIPKWGAGGRLLNVLSPTQIQLDRQVTLTPGKTYEIKVRLASTDEIVTKTVVAPGVEMTTDTLTVTTAFATLPTGLNDVYAFGESNISSKPFRVINITRSSNMIRKITALEYIEAIYTEATDVPVLQYSDQDSIFEVADISITEQNYRTPDGVNHCDLNVSWQYPRGKDPDAVHIYYRTGGGSWFYAGRYFQGPVTINGRPGQQTEIKIKVEKNVVLSSGITAIFVPAGKDDPPSDLSNIVVEQYEFDRTVINVTCSEITDIDCKGYEFRVGGSWEVGSVISNPSLSSRCQHTIDKSGTYSYWAKAIDNYGNYSKNAVFTSVTMEIEPPDVPSLMTEERPNGIRRFTWNYSPASDFAGFLMRYAYGVNTFWESAIPMHAGIIFSSPYETNSLPPGSCTVLIKAVSRAGIESKNVAYAVVNLGDTFVDNEIWTNDFKELGWPGSITGGTVRNGVIVANDNGNLFYGDPDAARYGTDNADFYKISYQQVTFQGTLTTPQAGLLRLDSSIEGSYQAFYRRNTAPRYGPAEQSFYGMGNDQFYTFADWVPYAGQFQTAEDIHDVQIIVSPGILPGKIKLLSAIMDLPDVSETVNDLVVAATGTRIPIAKTYYSINHVGYTVQKVSGQTALTCKILDKNNVLGPLIQCFDASGNAVIGTIDVKISGIGPVQN